MLRVNIGLRIEFIHWFAGGNNTFIFCPDGAVRSGNFENIAQAVSMLQEYYEKLGYKFKPFTYSHSRRLGYETTIAEADPIFEV